MPKDILDIVDTAVKIGLGALISGLTTFIITRKNHSNELIKERREKKASALEFAIENIEEYFDALEDYQSILDGFHASGALSGQVDENHWEKIGFMAIDDKLVSARKEKSLCISRLRLIGFDNLIEDLVAIETIEGQLRQQVIFNNTLPPYEELIAYKKRYIANKTDFYSAASKSFDSIFLE